MWKKPAAFVYGLINDELLAVDECGLVTNSELPRS
jgi:hypothetical protein